MNKTETKHTPGPWTANENLDLVFDADGNIVCENFFYHNAADEIREKKPCQIANMKFVLDACNNYERVKAERDELAAALRNLLDANDTDSFVGGEWDDARAALAKHEKR